MESFLTEPLMGVTFLSNFEKKHRTTFLVITVDKLTLLSIVQVPPSIECLFED